VSWQELISAAKERGITVVKAEVAVADFAPISVWMPMTLPPEQWTAEQFGDVGKLIGEAMSNVVSEQGWQHGGEST
jgi:hypothetical protein